VILVDTSVWVEHFRGDLRAERLPHLLEDGQVLLHPWVLGELVLGGLGASRQAVIADLRRLPPAPEVSDPEVLVLVQERGLSGRGIGWVDVHLVASACVAGSGLWTLDTRLAAVARDLGTTGLK
jgi:hypothetical protein